MSVDTEELKRLAEAAERIEQTDAEWQVRGGSVDAVRAKHAFLTAATPAAVLALLQRLEDATWNSDHAQRDNQILERDAETMKWERDNAKKEAAALLERVRRLEESLRKVKTWNDGADGDLPYEIGDAVDGALTP